MVIAIKTIRKIPFLKDYVKAKPIFEGSSEDLKYIIWVNDKKYILKLSNIDLLQNKKEEYKYVKALKKIHSAKVHAVGSIDEYSYIIYDYIEGEKAYLGVKKQIPDQQYELGIQAGKILKALHIKQITEASFNLEDKFLYTVDEVNKIKIEVPYLDKMVQIFNDYLKHIDLNEIVFCHGDFHPGNMIMNKDIYVFDFNQYKLSSIYYDFRRMFTYTRALSIPFCKGQLDGYFGRPLTDIDFKKMIPFLIYDLLDGIINANNLGKQELKNQINLIKMILDDFNNFETPIPNWYYFH